MDEVPADAVHPDPDAYDGTDDQDRAEADGQDKPAGAGDAFLAHLEDTVRQVRQHDCPSKGGCLYCLNLVAYMGERMGSVLARLRWEQARTRRP